jgi:NADP-dependent 3-hydroxy acid dehydrogenase YdfG
MLKDSLEPNQILITGATGSIGSALAHAYSAPGVRLHLHGRNPEKLFAVASSCRRLGATVFTHSRELRDLGKLEARRQRTVAWA